MSLQPVLLVHGWAGSFESTWQTPGVAELIRDTGRQVIGVDLLGHGTAPKPHEPEAYTDLTIRIFDAIPEGTTVDAVGFSLGAITLLEALTIHPERFGRVVLAGIGDRVFNRPDPADTARIIAGVEGTADESDKTARLFGHYAHQSNNDLVAMAAVLKRPARDPFTPEQIQKVSNEVLVVIGDHDSAGPSDMLATSFPSGKLKVIRNVDHFATTDAFAFIDAMLEFIEGN